MSLINMVNMGGYAFLPGRPFPIPNVSRNSKPNRPWATDVLDPQTGLPWGQVPTVVQPIGPPIRRGIKGRMPSSYNLAGDSYVDGKLDNNAIRLLDSTYKQYGVERRLQGGIADDVMKMLAAPLFAVNTALKGALATGPSQPASTIDLYGERAADRRYQAEVKKNEVYKRGALWVDPVTGAEAVDKGLLERERERKAAMRFANKMEPKTRAQLASAGLLPTAGNAQIGKPRGPNGEPIVPPEPEGVYATPSRVPRPPTTPKPRGYVPDVNIPEGGRMPRRERKVYRGLDFSDGTDLGFAPPIRIAPPSRTTPWGYRIPNYVAIRPPVWRPPYRVVKRVRRLPVYSNFAKPFRKRFRYRKFVHN